MISLGAFIIIVVIVLGIAGCVTVIGSDNVSVSEKGIEFEIEQDDTDAEIKADE